MLIFYPLVFFVFFLNKICADFVTLMSKHVEGHSFSSSKKL